MDEEILKYYEDVFNIKRERVEELINEFAKETIDRILREEVADEYIIENIYQIGKTEDERLFLAYLIGGIRQTVLATKLISMLAETLINKNIASFMESMSFYTQLPNVFWNELSDKLAVPDYKKLIEKDKDILEKMLLANKKLDDLIRRMKDDEKHNGRPPKQDS